MLKYILKRILFFIPTLIIISLLAFVISINAPGDPVENLVRSADKEGTSDSKNNSTEKTKAEMRKKLGLDLPVFYFGIGTFAESDTLYKIADKSHRSALERLSRTTGNWDQTIAFYHAINQTKLNLNLAIGDSVLGNDQNNLKNECLFLLNSLQEQAELDQIEIKMGVLDSAVMQLNWASFDIQSLKKSWQNLIEHQTTWKTYIPSIHWYGLKNQYHIWLFGDFLTGENRGRSGVVKGDFGLSYLDGQSVAGKIWDKFLVSFKLIFFSILLSYLISVPIGIVSAYFKDGCFDRTSSIVLFIMYSIPSYFAGTILLYTFANPDVLLWMPESGLNDPSVFSEDWSFWKRFHHQLPYYILPLICYTYGSFAFLSRIMRVGMVDVMQQDFVRTARAKGLSEKKVVLKHVLRNSMIPLITVFANVFPAAVGGSVIIEVIFSIQGMGLESYNAILNYDYPMIVAIFTISGGLTVLGYLVADILYAIVDPRISYK